MMGQTEEKKEKEKEKEEEEEEKKLAHTDLSEHPP